MSYDGNVVALAGGVGGAKLAQGLAATIPGEALSIIINTADDFQLYGLTISPDVDTVMYTLAGIANPATGWGIADDTHETLAAIARYGENPWFTVGDRDFATHILRSHALSQGATLTDVTSRLATALGIQARLLPMTDRPVATEVLTTDGWLEFQEYFVARRHADDVLDVRFNGIEHATPSRALLDAIAAASVIIFCPSNPIVSIGPILAVPGMREALATAKAPIVAVSPIVGGRALKGPADQMLAARGVEVSAIGVAGIYGDLLGGIVIDTADAALESPLRDMGLQVLTTQTIMGDLDDRARLAGEILATDWMRD